MMKYVDVGGYWCVTVLAVIYGLSFFFLCVHLFVLLISFVIVCPGRQNLQKNALKRVKFFAVS